MSKLIFDTRHPALRYLNVSQDEWDVLDSDEKKEIKWLFLQASMKGNLAN